MRLREGLCELSSLVLVGRAVMKPEIDSESASRVPENEPAPRTHPEEKPQSDQSPIARPDADEGSEVGKNPPVLANATPAPALTNARDCDEPEDDVGLFIPLEDDDLEDGENRKRRRKMPTKRKLEIRPEEEEAALSCDVDQTLDRTLEDGAKQHNLTVVNVRNILHEVITNEHVVAMMKAAISETEDVPTFVSSLSVCVFPRMHTYVWMHIYSPKIDFFQEPKMTRSKLKEVVEKGVVIPTWNLSPIKKAGEVKAPQFVDIPLEEEDLSDEEYQPEEEEEEEDETAEESLLESDVESTSSSPVSAKRQRVQYPSESTETDEEGKDSWQVQRAAPGFVRHISAEAVPMGPPPPPKPKQEQDSSFMEKLHAVDEELASSSVCMESNQSLNESLIACRTRSKRPLKDIPIGQLEAKFRAPDITPDMYDPNTADDEEWKMWLGSLMREDVGNEDEADDDDDPEYNFLADLDEPDTEDFRNDRAVRITKKEVNELMEELFETFQDEVGFSHVKDADPEDEDGNPEAHSNFNTPHAIRFQEPLANLLNEQHRTVKEQLELLRMRKSMTKPNAQELEEPKAPPPRKVAPVLFLDGVQKRRLQQQMQQHVQLLTQMHLLSCRNPSLSLEADTARIFLVELSSFAENSSLIHRSCNPDFQSIFHAWNLKDALHLLSAFHSQIPEACESPKPERKTANEFSSLPKHVAWIMATRPLFMYPELLPIITLKARGPRDKVFFTKAEDNLLALGLKHFEGTELSKTLISKYLLTAKTAHQLTVRIKNLILKKTPDNIIKYYKKTKLLPIMFKCCDDVLPHDAKPPVEREKHRLPFWLKASFMCIEEEMENQEKAAQGSDSRSRASKYPLLIPPGLTLTLKPLSSRFSRRAWRQKRSSILKPLLIQPSCSASASCLPKTASKPYAPQPLPVKISERAPPPIQPAVSLQCITGIHPISMPGWRKALELCVPLPSDGRGRQIPVTLQPTSVAQVPVTQPKMMLPALTTQRVRKPLIRRVPRRKTVSRTLGLRAAPFINSPHVIFAVPNGALKLVSLGTACGVIQPLGTGVGIPVTTLLLNPTHFPLSQTVATARLATSEDLVAAPILPTPGSDTDCDVKSEEETDDSKDKVKIPKEAWDCFTGNIKLEEEGSPATAREGGGPEQDGLSAEEHGGPEQEGGDTTGDGGGLEQEGGDTAQDNGGHSAPVGEGNNPAPPEGRGPVAGKEESDPLEEDNCPSFPRSPVDEKPEIKSECDTHSAQRAKPEGHLRPEQSEVKEVYIEEQNVDVSSPPQAVLLMKAEQAAPEDPGDTQEPQGEERHGLHPAKDEEKRSQTKGRQSLEAVHPEESPKNTSSSTDGDVDMGSPVGTHHDSSSPSGRQESGNDKDGQEEEEEEDFDDLTQDEDEEEMSSASEESVLSVPELQETMEKLTWLASETRLSQEGESEEENSQEENSEPEEEEEEGEGMESSSQKEEEMTDEVTETRTEQAPCHLNVSSPAPVETNTAPIGERRKGSTKGPSSHRVRSRRGRARASKDTSKLLLLYDENILLKDPLREQKDMAFAQAYLNRVREALQHVPGKYEQFLHMIYQFETSGHKRTAVDLYQSLRGLLHDWPQLLKDFAAFLLPEQALECGLFEEQQAFDKSRKFLRQLEICFLENPAQHQKIIKLLQSCAECPPQEISKLKAQMWQLLKGHNHLQDEFSLFFDQLRPPASRMGDFEVINWIEENEYKDMDWLDGGKECPCSCHEGGAEQRLKRSKRRTCSHCSNKVCESRPHRSRETPEVAAGGPPSALRPGPTIKELGGQAEGRLLLSRGPASEERLIPGTRGPTSTKETHIPDSNVCTQRSRSAAHTRGFTVTDSTEPSKTRPPRGGADTTYRVPPKHSKDPPRPASRGGRRPLTARSLVPAVETLGLGPERQQHSSCYLPSSPLPLPSPMLPTAGAFTESLAKRMPSCSAPKSMDCESDPSSLTLGTLSRKDLPIPQPTEFSGREEQMLTVCAKNITVSSSGEKVILWTREADRVILTMCQELGAQDETFTAISLQLRNKSPAEVSQRFQELVRLFQTACVTSSDEEEEAGSITEQLSDQDAPLSEGDPED
ncbi:hypothetical protein FKM82_028033 [Ascaphus truei]